MSKPARAAALSLLLLAACGNGERASEQNYAVEAESKVLEDSSALDPGLPGAPVNGIADPVPPPDAVSHPNGYLPPAPAEAEPANASVGSSRVDLQACKLEYSIVSPK